MVEYILDGTKIIYERVYNTTTDTPVLTSETMYSYDSMGTPNGAKVKVYSGTTATTYEFFFRTTIQGDVLAIYDGSTNAQVVSFNYDAWGNYTTTASNATLSQIALNYTHLRYRGYYQDFETGFYYLNSRYYDTKMCRFINADQFGYLGANGDFTSFNLFAYCGNNPVMHVDPTGHSIWDALKNFVSNWYKSIEAEFGLGLGFGASGEAVSEQTKASATAYRDTTIFYDDGKLLVGNAVSYELSVSDLGIGGSHKQYTDGKHESVHGHGYAETIFDDAGEIIQCPNCHHNNALFSASIPVGEGSKVSAVSDGTFGVGASIHFIIGGHFSIGFNAYEFVQRVWEDLLK